MFSLAAAGLVCGGSPSPALAQSPPEAPPRPTATPTPPVPKYRDILVAWLTDPNDRLGPVSETFAASTTIKFRMQPPRDDWQLLYLDNQVHQYDEQRNIRWRCLSQSGNSAIDASTAMGRVYTYNWNASYNSYVRGVVLADPDDNACESITIGGRSNTSVAVLGDVFKIETRAIYFTSGTVVPNREPTPDPKFTGVPTLQTADDLLYQTPGGPWTTQMLVSIGAAAVVMIVLRSMIGLLIGIAVMPAAAFGMATIGYGNYWYVMVVGLLFVFSAVAWGVVARRS